MCCIFSGTEAHGGRHEACGGHHKCNLFFRPFLMFMANAMRHVAVGTSLGLRLQTSFFLAGGFHACLVMAWAMEVSMEVSASVFFSHFSPIFAIFVRFLHKLTLTLKVPKTCINHNHNTIKYDIITIKHV